MLYFSITLAMELQAKKDAYEESIKNPSYFFNILQFSFSV